jgi:ubiquinone/menaquinone biosynthesis C-methylase UbiE
MHVDELATRYYGNTALQYDAKRARTAQWDREQSGLATILGTLDRGSTIVDIPVGTGRFLEIYAQHGLRATGLDVSTDMLQQARSKATSLGLTIDLRKSDIRNINAADDAFDAALCVRFLNWVNLAGLDAAIGQLARVARSSVLCAIRHYAPLGDLNVQTRRGAMRLAKQVVTRIRKRFTGKDGLVFHEKREIAGVLAKHRLEVVSATCIEHRSDGTDYYVYHLRKRR